MPPSPSVSRPVPRGLARTGPVLFSYGFRPFFLGGALWAIAAMSLWIAAIAGHLTLAQEYGAANWHAHEMLFGFASAVLAGFLLTAVPNWTGRLPVSGWPLAGLFALARGASRCLHPTRSAFPSRPPSTRSSCPSSSPSARARSWPGASGRT